MKGVRNEQDHQLSHKGSQSIYFIQKEKGKVLDNLDGLKKHSRNSCPGQGSPCEINLMSWGSQPERKFGHFGIQTSEENENHTVGHN